MTTIHDVSRPARPAVTPRPPAPTLPRHLLATGDLSRGAAELILDTAERIDQAIAGREVR
jgi:aspartate carbamoyltransferase catalytic subunit